MASAAELIVNTRTEALAAAAIWQEAAKVMDAFAQSQQPSGNSKSKRKQVAAACVACQRAKAKVTLAPSSSISIHLYGQFILHTCTVRW